MTTRGRLAAALVGVLLGVGVAQAQVIPTTYRMTRTAPGEPTLTTEFAAAAIACNLPVGPVSGQGFRFSDPVNANRDCEYITAAPFSNWRAGVAYRFTLAGKANDIDGYGPESAPFDSRTPAVPGAPGSLRVNPGVQSVALDGRVVRPPSALFGLEAVPIALEIGGITWFGATRLEVPGYRVQDGDRVSFVFWREAPAPAR